MACLDTLFDEVLHVGLLDARARRLLGLVGRRDARGYRGHGALDAHNAVRALGAHVQVVRE